MASLPNGSGYWLTDAAGGVSAHGNAVNYGSMAGHVLNAPVNHIVATPDGKGYWLVAADGGTFTFGDAGFYGSTGNIVLNAPVVDIAPTQTGKGYWLVASDGGIFSFGDAQFHGSMGGQPPEQAGCGHECRSQRRLLAGGHRRRHLLLRGAVLRVDREHRVEQAGQRHGGDRQWARVLVRGLRRGDLLLRRRPVPRLHRETSPSTPRSWAWRPASPPVGTGWWPPTAGSSPSAPRSSEPTERPGRSRQTQVGGRWVGAGPRAPVLHASPVRPGGLEPPNLRIKCPLLYR